MLALKLLKKVRHLYTVLQVDANVFNNLDERTKQHRTANYFSWMWFAFVGTDENSKMLNTFDNLYKANNLTFVQFSALQSIKINQALKHEIKITNKLENVTTTLAEEPGEVLYDHASKQFPMHLPANMYASDVQRYSDNTKMANAVVNHFRDRCFNGDTTQSINCTPRNFETSAAQFELTELEKATYFVNILEPPARNFFFRQLQSPDVLQLCFENDEKIRPPQQASHSPDRAGNASAFIIHEKK